MEGQNDGPCMDPEAMMCEGAVTNEANPTHEELYQIVARAERERADGAYADYDAVSRELRERYGLERAAMQGGVLTKGELRGTDALNGC